MTDPETVEGPRPTVRRGRGVRRFFSGLIFGAIVPLAILAGGAYGAKTLMESGPTAKRKPHARRARVVTVDRVRFGAHDTVVRAMGAVLAARTAEIQPRISGEINSLSDQLIPGGLVDGGDELIAIDPSDYEIAVLIREADVASAKSKLDLELGNQAVAKREYELLGDSVNQANRDLVLRKPQLDAAKAAVASAEAALARAKLDLSRTSVRAPFDALVKERYVDLGTQVNTTTRIAALQGTGEFWVEVAVPVDELEWIRIPTRSGEPGSPVRVYDDAAWGAGAFREGTVLRLVGDVEARGRMARLLVSVPDPLAREPSNAGLPRLILSSYVRVEIEGARVARAAMLARRLLRNGDRVWIMNEADALEIRDVEVAFRGEDAVYVTAGIEEGERIVVSDLSSPVPGMPLRVEDGGEGASGAARSGADGER